MTCYRDDPRRPPPLSSTVVRDHERCPWRPRLLDYDADQVTSVPAAAGVAFDDQLRRRLTEELGGTPKPEDLAWISPILRPQARILGKKLLVAYVRSGAYDRLLEEGVVEPDPPRGWGILYVKEGRPILTPYVGEEASRKVIEVLRGKGNEAYLVATRPDVVVRGPSAGTTRVLDYKTTGTLRGATIPGGYARRWRGGVDLGPTRVEQGPPHHRPEWLDQVGFYGPFLGTPYVGIEALVVGRGWRTVDVASYRWKVTGTDELLDRYLAVGRALLGPEPATVEPGARCFAYNRLCRCADRCPARGGSS